MCSAFNPACVPKSAGQQNDTCIVKFMTYKESFAVLLQESDGSWEDLSDEERQAEEATRRAKGTLPLDGPVLEEIERQEAEMCAQQVPSIISQGSACKVQSFFRFAYWSHIALNASHYQFSLGFSKIGKFVLRPLLSAWAFQHPHPPRSVITNE